MKRLLNLLFPLLSTGMVVAAVFAAGTAFAQPGTQLSIGPEGRLTSGKREFRRYCSQCHGVSGVGNGPVAESLKKKPANLTLLAKNNGGVFPAKKVREYIDGTKFEAAHGSREMPIWGTAFKYNMGSGWVGPNLTKAQVDKKIDMLVEYIKGIQKE